MLGLVHLFICSFIHLLSTHQDPDSILHAEEIMVKETQVPPLNKFAVSSGETDHYDTMVTVVLRIEI